MPRGSVYQQDFWNYYAIQQRVLIPFFVNSLSGILHYKLDCFSTYGDATFLLIQSAIISFLTISWEMSYLYGLAFLGSYVCFVAYTLSPAVKLSLLALMQAANTPVILFSRVAFFVFSNVLMMHL